MHRSSSSESVAVLAHRLASEECESRLIDEVPLVGRYVKAFVCFNFHVDRGVVVETIVPRAPGGVLGESLKRALSFHAFPDTSTQRLGDLIYTFRLPVEADLSLPLPARFLYGAAFFRQVRDPARERGYFQKSLVVLSPLAIDSAMISMLNVIAPLFFTVGDSALEAVCHGIAANWPDPVPGATIDVPLLGSVLRISVPDLVDPAQLAPDAPPELEGPSAAAPGCVSEPSSLRSGRGALGLGGAALSSLGRKVKKKLIVSIPLAPSSSQPPPALSPPAKSQCLLSSIVLFPPVHAAMARRGASSRPPGGTAAAASSPSAAPSPATPAASSSSAGQLVSPPGASEVLGDALLPRVWSLWEMLLLGEPLVVMALRPDQTSRAVRFLLGLINPIPYGGDYRPYFTINDGAFRTYMQGPSAGKLPLVLGVTNPLFVKLAADWGSILYVEGGELPASEGEEAGGRVAGSAGGRAVMPKAGLRTSFSGTIAPDTELLKRLSGLSGEARDGILSQHFLQLTTSFLSPFDGYFVWDASTRPAGDPSLWTLPDSPILPAFRKEAFLGELTATFLTSATGHALARAQAWVGLYERFIGTRTFARWFELKREQSARLFAQSKMALMLTSDPLRCCFGLTEPQLLSAYHRIKTIMEAPKLSPSQKEIIATHLDAVKARLPPDLRDLLRAREKTIKY